MLSAVLRNVYMKSSPRDKQISGCVFVTATQGVDCFPITWCPRLSMSASAIWHYILSERKLEKMLYPVI